MMDCVHLKFWVKDPRIPINYDAESESYSLELSDDLIIKPMYCNICGSHKRINAKSKFPPCRCGKPGRWSQDSSLPIHYDPSLNVYELWMKHGPLKADPVDIQIYGIKDINQSLEYNHLTPTAILHVTESEDGLLRYSFSGHQRQKTIFIHRLRTFYYQVMHYLQRFNVILWQYTDKNIYAQMVWQNDVMADRFSPAYIYCLSYYRTLIKLYRRLN